MRSLWLPESDALMAWSGITRMFIKKDLHRFCVNNVFNLVDDGFCYGVIRIDRFVKIPQNRFDDYKEDHMLTLKDKRARWKPPNKTVYGYKFSFIEKYDPVRKVIVCKGTSEFTDLVLICKGLTNKLIKNPREYVVKGKPLEELLFVWDVLEKQYLMSEYFGVEFNITDVLFVARKILSKVEGRLNESSLMYDLLKNG